MLTHISRYTSTIMASCASDPALAYFPCSVYSPYSLSTLTRLFMLVSISGYPFPNTFSFSWCTSSAWAYFP
ncbi:uncharacterized protein K441DRAFT_11252 [Cenococcum geophilum 1.58]|uniref:uncharacterized protein n=1 Tax=Cenococcum geophilum 1.58 TaxID=794803 RepID=UPI00358EC810|nr:hypothetical protein K441DRAFT_11252 [Cenococcum geophilum 1.58]